MNLMSYLDDHGVPYHVSYHPTVYTAQTLAAAEHVPGMQVIKPVVIEADGHLMMCALPASHRIDLEELRNQLEVDHVRIIGEEELKQIFNDCELGAEPPIGRLFGLPTVMDSSLLNDDRVTFQAGTHDSSVTMRLVDFRRVAQPELAHFGRQMA
jgi:Ala-tRNA(Pro) deacylase